MLPSDGKNLVTPRLFHSSLVRENERVVGKEPLRAEAGRFHLSFLHECRGERMPAEKDLDGVLLATNTTTPRLTRPAGALTSAVGAPVPATPPYRTAAARVTDEPAIAKGDDRQEPMDAN
jgi:hypothetical protein